MRKLDIALHAVPALISLGVIVIFVRRRLNREFPAFFLYLLYVPLATVLRMSVKANEGIYYWSYWATEGLYGVLALFVLREVFHRLFSWAYAAHRWVRLLLPLTVLLIFALSIRQTIYHPLGRGIPPLVNAIYWFDLGVHLLEGVILLLLLALTAVFPISWRRYEFGILAGFGINASITMLAYLFRFEWGSRYETLFRYGPPLGFVLTTLIWLHAFLRPPESVPGAQMGPDEMLGVVRRSRELLDKIEKGLGLRRRAFLPPV